LLKPTVEEVEVELGDPLGFGKHHTGPLRLGRRVGGPHRRMFIELGGDPLEAWNLDGRFQGAFEGLDPDSRVSHGRSQPDDREIAERARSLHLMACIDQVQFRPGQVLRDRLTC